MLKNGLLKDAKACLREIVGVRRYLHTNAEVGFDLGKTLSFVKSKLEEIGCVPKECGRAGIVATVGNPVGKAFLLRADMDALPLREQSGVPFACKSGRMHACGHDMHTAMLLGAARLLKARESLLHGQVKLLFQPAEEILEGAKNVVEAGALEAPEVDAAMMLHVMTGVELPAGTVVVSSAGVGAPAADYFTIKVRGKGCHGSAPWNGVDALTAAAHILLALQEISARELSLAQPAVLTVGSLKTPMVGNAIPDEAILHGTLRAFDENVRATVKNRIEGISESVAKAFRARAKVIFGGGCPTLGNDGELSSFVESAAKNLLGDDCVYNSGQLCGEERARNIGSEDFAYISHAVPSVMVALAAGRRDEGYKYPLHHPKATFDEAALPIGSALYAHIAIEWLNNNNIVN